MGLLDVLNAMANNRLYLVHEPSNTGIGLAKHMTQGWYGGAERLNDFFDYTYNYSIEHDCDWEKLVIMTEDDIDFKTFKQFRGSDKKWWQLWK